MKKLIILNLISALTLFTGSAVAGFSDPSMGNTQGSMGNTQSSMGGFNGGAAGITTVKMALENQYGEDTPVVLTGNILKSLGDEKYLFADSTGRIRVEIDREDWGGLNVTPSTKIMLYGEIDMKRSGKEIDVDYVRLAK